MENQSIGYTVSVREVVCEFGKSTGFQAVMTIYRDGKAIEIPNTIWQDFHSAKYDRDQMFENAEMWLEQ